MSSKPNRILVVDDRVENRRSIGALLTIDGGYETEHAQTISDAIDRIQSGSIDLVLTDIRMEKDDDGLQLLRQVKARWPIMPVVVYTGFGSVRDAVLATKLGAADYLEWPLEPDVILAAISAALATRHCLPLRDENCAGMSSSASRRWTAYVLKAVASPDDPKTLSDWARCAGVSYTSLREACYLLGIQPQDARDFTRALRVVVGLSHGAGRLTTLLNTSNRRSLNWFCQRVGISADALPQPVDLEAFLRAQTLIPPDNEGLEAVRQALASKVS